MKYYDNPEITFLYLFGFPFVGFAIGVLSGLIISEIWPFWTFEKGVLCAAGLAAFGLGLGTLLVLRRRRKIFGKQHNHPAVQEYFANRGKNEPVLHNDSH